MKRLILTILLASSLHAEQAQTEPKLTVAETIETFRTFSLHSRYLAGIFKISGDKATEMNFIARAESFTIAADFLERHVLVVEAPVAPTQKPLSPDVRAVKKSTIKHN